MVIIKKIFYIILFIFSFIIITPKTYAYTNMSTYYNVNMPDYETDYKNKTCGNTTLYDFINRFISSVDWSTSSYQVFITGHYIYFVQTSYVNENQGHKVWVKGSYYTSSVGNYYAFGYTASKSTYPAGSYVFYFEDNCQESDLERVFNYLVDVAQNGNYNPNWQNNFTIGFYNAGSTYYSSIERINSISNNSSYNVNLWWYYSSYNLFMANNSEAQGNNNYWKTIHINDNNTDYGLESQLPSYYDLYPPIEEPTQIGYKTSLDTFYTSIPVNNVSNYQLKFGFRVPQSILGSYQTTNEYIDNTRFNYICSGRVDNTNYYTYENFPCSLSYSYTSTESIIDYTFNNFSTSSSLSNYDKIYITIDTNYLDSNISTTLFDFNYLYNLGDFYNTSYKGSIYEKFNNLPLNFSVYFSSNNSIQDSTLFVRKSNFINYNIKYNGFSNTTQQQNLVIGNSILGSNDSTDPLDFISTQVSNSIDTGIMIYQKDSIIPVPSLDLFFNSGMVVSFNYNSSSDNFYYIDNTGSIENNNFIKPTYTTDSTKYDISYYVGVINDFINDLSTDTLQVSSLTQNFYNSLPLFFQTFIFVIFVLFCIYFTYLLIKR